MKTDKEFDNILDECLERLLVEGETIEQCLKRYPEQAVELEPLLQTALEAKEASTVQPRAEFKARARYQFRSVLGEAFQKSRPFFGWLPRWATVVAIVLVVLLAGGGTVVVASNSMPDSPLYAVKLATEEAQLMLTPSELGKARLCAELVDRRVEEIIYMAGKGDVQQIELVTQHLDERLEKLAVLASALGEKDGAMLLAPPADEETAVPGGWGGQDVRAGANGWHELRMKVASHAAENQAALQAILEEAPGVVKPALRRAIAVSLAGYQKALEALD